MSHRLWIVGERRAEVGARSDNYWLIANAEKLNAVSVVSGLAEDLDPISGDLLDQKGTGKADVGESKYVVADAVRVDVMIGDPIISYQHELGYTSVDAQCDLSENDLSRAEPHVIAAISCDGLDIDFMHEDRALCIDGWTEKDGSGQD